MSQGEKQQAGSSSAKDLSLIMTLKPKVLPSNLSYQRGEKCN